MNYHLDIWGIFVDCDIVGWRWEDLYLDFMTCGRHQPSSLVGTVPACCCTSAAGMLTYDFTHKPFLSLKYCKNYICCTFNSDDPISSQFCTCHDSLAVVACAKLWTALIIIFHIQATHILTVLHYYGLRNCCMMGVWLHMTCKLLLAWY